MSMAEEAFGPFDLMSALSVRTGAMNEKQAAAFCIASSVMRTRNGIHERE